MNTENITRVGRLDLNTVLYSGSAYQSQGSSAAGHWIKTNITCKGFPEEGELTLFAATIMSRANRATLWA